MNKEKHRIFRAQQKKFSESLKKDKEVWQGIYCVVEAYTKEFNNLLNTGNKKVSK